MASLNEYMDRPVRELVAGSPREISEGEKERHYIYSLLLMSMVAFNWNANKPGTIANRPSPDKDYGQNSLPVPKKYKKRGQFLNRDYLGHNIAAFAVDRDGNIMDFDFNHNEIFNSSIEHAEARLLSRLFKLTQIHTSWAAGGNSHEESRYGSQLEGVTVYTSLESCAQCSGIMTLGNVKEVVYLQDDPGQYKIGNIMYRLTTDPNKPERKPSAPRPVPASAFNFKYFTDLSQKYVEFEKEQRQGITSFLCTEPAYMLYLKAEEEFATFIPKYKDWKPLGAEPITLTNEGVLKECMEFYNYFSSKGRRGTPH